MKAKIGAGFGGGWLKKTKKRGKTRSLGSRLVFWAAFLGSFWRSQVSALLLSPREYLGWDWGEKGEIPTEQRQRRPKKSLSKGGEGREPPPTPPERREKPEFLKIRVEKAKFEGLSGFFGVVAGFRGGPLGKNGREKGIWVGLGWERMELGRAPGGEMLVKGK